MKETIYILTGLAIVLAFTGVAIAQEFIVFPAQGQSNEQMEKDKFGCYTWARDQTGFDPMQMPTASSPPPSGEKTSTSGTARNTSSGGAAAGTCLLPGGRW